MAKVRIDDKSVRLYFAGMTNRMRDMTEVLRWAGEQLAEGNRRNFLSQGVASGAPWNPLDPEYALWKAKHYGPSPILVRTGKLMMDLTNFTRASSFFLGGHSARFGTSIEYAKYHQSGTRFMPRRKIIYLPPGFAERLAEKTGDEIVYGGGPAGAARKAKGATNT